MILAASGGPRLGGLVCAVGRSMRLWGGGSLRRLSWATPGYYSLSASLRTGCRLSEAGLTSLLHRMLLSLVSEQCAECRCTENLNHTRSSVQPDAANRMKKERSNRPRGAPRRSKRGKDDSSIFVR